MRSILLAAVAAAAVGCGQKKSAAPDVGLVFDVGGRGDKSFNDAAYAGLQKGESELKLKTEYVEIPGSSDREAGLRKLAEKGIPIVFGIGFAFTDTITAVAKDFPGQKFACVDYDAGGKTLPPNLAALCFKEEEGSFLVGAIAGLCTKKNKVGFVGGMDIPLIHKFLAGYKAGVAAVNPGCEVIANFAGMTPDAFKDPVKGKELAKSQYGAGADIIFHASGSTGLGVFQAAKEANAEPGGGGHFVIGVDSDQWEEGGHVLTSMLKRVDVAVFETIKAQRENRFKAGVQVFGLKEDGVGYVLDKRNEALIPPDVRAKVDALKKQIVDGKIVVPDK